MTDDDLLALDKIGFIPGPGEDEQAFSLRVTRAKEKFQGGHWIPDPHWDWVRHYLGEMFHVKPLYICAYYSNRGLAPWQGAASWIEGKTLHSIQLRTALRGGSYLGMYRREEILAHEAVHAARCAFDGDVYEEFFAYMSSEKKWRRVLGPILERPWEIYPFFLFSLGGALYPVCYLAAAGWAAIGFGRLIRRHRVLNKAFKNVGSRAILFRLTDQEIELFAQGASLEEYAKKQGCLRWRLIRKKLAGQKEGIGGMINAK